MGNVNKETEEKSKETNNRIISIKLMEKGTKCLVDIQTLAYKHIYTPDNKNKQENKFKSFILGCGRYKKRYTIVFKHNELDAYGLIREHIREKGNILVIELIWVTSEQLNYLISKSVSKVTLSSINTISYTEFEPIEKQPNIKPMSILYMIDSIRGLTSDKSKFISMIENKEWSIQKAEGAINNRAGKTESKAKEIESKTEGVESKTEGVESKTEGVESKTEGVESKTGGTEKETSVKEVSTKMEVNQQPNKNNEQLSTGISDELRNLVIREEQLKLKERRVDELINHLTKTLESLSNTSKNNSESLDVSEVYDEYIGDTEESESVDVSDIMYESILKCMGNGDSITIPMQYYSRLSVLLKRMLEANTSYTKYKALAILKFSNTTKEGILALTDVDEGDKKIRITILKPYSKSLATDDEVYAYYMRYQKIKNQSINL